MSGIFGGYAEAFGILFKYLFIGFALVAVVTAVALVIKKLFYNRGIEISKMKAEKELKRKNEQHEEIKRTQREIWANMERGTELSRGLLNDRENPNN